MSNRRTLCVAVVGLLSLSPICTQAITTTQKIILECPERDQATYFPPFPAIPDTKYSISIDKVYVKGYSKGFITQSLEDMLEDLSPTDEEMLASISTYVDVFCGTSAPQELDLKPGFYTAECNKGESLALKLYSPYKDENGDRVEFTLTITKDDKKPSQESLNQKSSNSVKEQTSAVRSDSNPAFSKPLIQNENKPPVSSDDKCGCVFLKKDVELSKETDFEAVDFSEGKEFSENTPFEFLNAMPNNIENFGWDAFTSNK